MKLLPLCNAIGSSTVGRDGDWITVGWRVMVGSRAGAATQKRLFLGKYAT
jgi:hypothetical protein